MKRLTSKIRFKSNKKKLITPRKLYIMQIQKKKLKLVKVGVKDILK